jgi:hypothetical protein
MRRIIIVTLVLFACASAQVYAAYDNYVISRANKLMKNVKLDPCQANRIFRFTSANAKVNYTCGSNHFNSAPPLGYPCEGGLWHISSYSVCAEDYLGVYRERVRWICSGFDPYSINARYRFTDYGECSLFPENPCSFTPVWVTEPFQ